MKQPGRKKALNSNSPATLTDAVNFFPVHLNLFATYLQSGPFHRAEGH